MHYNMHGWFSGALQLWDNELSVGNVSCDQGSQVVPWQRGIHRRERDPWQTQHRVSRKLISASQRGCRSFTWTEYECRAASRLQWLTVIGSVFQCSTFHFVPGVCWWWKCLHASRGKCSHFISIKGWIHLKDCLQSAHYCHPNLIPHEW